MLYFLITLLGELFKLFVLCLVIGGTIRFGFGGIAKSLGDIAYEMRLSREKQPEETP